MVRAIAAKSALAGGTPSGGKGPTRSAKADHGPGWTCDALESEEMNQNGQRAIANGNMKQWPDANPFGSRHQDCGWAARPEKRRVLEVSIGCSGLS